MFGDDTTATCVDPSSARENLQPNDQQVWVSRVHIALCSTPVAC